MTPKPRGGLINRFAGAATPGEPVEGPLQADHQSLVLSGDARGIADHYDFVAGLERLSCDALVAQLRGAAPFERPSAHHAFRVWRLDGYEGMRVFEDELH